MVLSRELHELATARLRRPLAGLRRKLRLLIFVEGTVRLGVLVFLTCLVQLLIDRGLRLSLDQRALLNVPITMLWLWAAHRWLIAPLARPRPDAALAAAVDAANPHLVEQLGTAVQFLDGGRLDPESNSPALVQAVVTDACLAARQVRFDDVIDRRRLRRRSLQLAAIVGTATVLWTALPSLVGTWFARNWLLQEIAWPQRTRLVPEGFDADGRRRIPRGDELRIIARIEGVAPDAATLTWNSVDGERGRERMVLIGGRRFEADLGAVRETVRFRISGGDELTREFTIEAVERPTVVRTLARVVPLDYTGLPPLVIDQQLALELPAGSTLELEAWLNKPVVQATFSGGDGVAIPAELLAGDHARILWAEPQSGAYTLELLDRDGWNDRRPPRFTLRIAPDRAPVVRHEPVDVGELITPQAEFAIRMSSKDDYGLARAELLLQRNDGPAELLPLRGFEAGRPEFETRLELVPVLLRGTPGDRLRIWAEASDANPDGAGIGRSEPTVLQVVTLDELLADLARREQELRMEFEQLLSAQRGLQDAVVRLLAELPPGAPPAAASQRLAGLARRQETHVARITQITRRFERILAEMAANRAMRSGDDQRIGQRIIQPLQRLSGTLVPDAATLLQEVRRDVNSASAGAVVESQAQLVREMRAILTQMLEWEGYREAVALVEELIRQQQEVRDATLGAIGDALDDILGDLPPASAPVP